MPTTVVDLCNMALAHLRQRPVAGDLTGVTGDTAEASNCRRFYEISMREAFRAYDWAFARQYSFGVKIPGAVVPNWKYAYEIPNNVELVRYVAQNSRTEAPIRFRVMLTSATGQPQQAVFTNEDDAWLVCTIYLPTPEMYPADFVEFAALTLAAHLAMPITGKAELMMGMRKLAEDAGKRAAATWANSETEDWGEDPAREEPPVPSDPLAVANAALGMLGQGALVAFGDRTKQGDAVRRFYQQALRSALRAVDWPFARAFTYAAQADAPAVPGWRYAFVYPDNCAALRSVPRRYPLDHEVRFQIYGRVIYTNVSELPLRYTRSDADPSTFDADFLSLLTYELAALIALPLTGKGDATAIMKRLAKDVTDKARADAMNEEPNELDERVPDWLAARGIPSLTREDRERSMQLWGYGRQMPPWGALPGSPQVNPTPPMITGPGPGSQILPAYIPGLTAPVEPPAPLLSSSDWWVESVGGRIESDGRLVVDDPSQSYVEPEYDVQEDN